MTKKRKAVTTGVAVGVVAVVVVAMMPDPVPVDLVTATRGELVVTVDEKGQTRVRERYVVAAPVAGDLGRIELREGDPVAEGQVVATIVPPPLDARQREEVRTAVAAAQASVSEAEAQAERASATAELRGKDLERIRALSSSGIASVELLDQAETAERAAARELEAARFRVRAARSQLEAARAGLLAIEGGTGRTIELRSPVAGQVLSIPERSSRVVRAGETVMTVGDPSSIEIMIEVLSADAVKIEPGNRILIDDWGGDATLEGVVRLVEPAGFTKISALGIEEQRVRVIGNLVGEAPSLGDAYRVEARIVIWADESVLRVPVSALFRSDGGWAVYAVDGNRAARREVTVGHRSPLEAEVLLGLREGEIVILHPSNRIEDGVRVVGR
jgi:HlyD family secretion protein